MHSRAPPSTAPQLGYPPLLHASAHQGPRYMGLGSEWKPRWCVIMPRMPNPVTGPAREQQLARSLLVVYKAADQQQPACKAWLDGAVARSVVGSRGSSQAQCQLVRTLL